MAATSFNSSEYAWKDLKVVAMGRVFEGITEVKYKVTQDKSYSYGRGQNPHGIQRKNKKYDGSIKLLQSEVEALIRNAQTTNPNADLTDIVFDIQISYQNDAGIIVRDRVRGAEFSDLDKGMKQGDAEMEVTLPFMAMGIQYNI